MIVESLLELLKPGIQFTLFVQLQKELAYFKNIILEQRSAGEVQDGFIFFFESHSTAWGREDHFGSLLDRFSQGLDIFFSQPGGEFEKPIADKGKATAFLPGEVNPEPILSQNLDHSQSKTRIDIIGIAAVEVGYGIPLFLGMGFESLGKGPAAIGRHGSAPGDSQSPVEKPAEKSPSKHPVGDRRGPASQFLQKVSVAEEPVPERGPAGLFPGQAGFNVQVGNGYVLRADPLADLAVVAILQPLQGNGLPLKAETFRIRSGQLGPGKKPRGLQHRAVGVTDGTLNALVDVGFHIYFFTKETQRTRRKLSTKFTSLKWIHEAGFSFYVF
jgi:hypothetical protein